MMKVKVDLNWLRMIDQHLGVVEDSIVHPNDPSEINANLSMLQNARTYIQDKITENEEEKPMKRKEANKRLRIEQDRLQRKVK